VTEVGGDVVKRRWEREQTLLGLARDTPDEKFAIGGLGALAVPPTVRIVVLPSDPCSHTVPGQDPNSVIPQQIMVPGGRELARYETARGTSSGYVGYPYAGDDGLWRSFAAVHWHGGVEFFLGKEGGLEWEFAPGSRRRVFFLRMSVGWAWGAFGFQRQMVEQFQIPGPFRAIFAVSQTAGAILGNLGDGWPQPGGASLFGQPSAIEPRVLLLEDLPEWPDATGVEALALRFGSRLDLAFGGSGDRHLNRTGPDAGRFTPQW
jgi:hypothetical protein